MKENLLNDAREYSLKTRHAGPSIGIALGGGAARGWAHIGAVKRLTDHGVIPDVVCGTSIGALVGGFWLSGAIDDLEAWARDLTKRRMLSYFDLIFKGSGLMGGKRLEKALQNFLHETQIEELPTKFVAVCAEMETGHETWLMEGSLSQAIEAAYALPGIFPPRNVNQRWLIDGALVNPLPVSVCRAFGARLVIAIGLHADAFGRAAVNNLPPAGHDAEDINPYTNNTMQPIREKNSPRRTILNGLTQGNETTPGVGSVMMASFNIVMDRITRSRLAGDPPDVLIQPQVSHLTFLDFDKADELIALGEKAVDDAMPTIKNAIAQLA